MQEQIHRLSREQLPIHVWRYQIELPHIISPSELNLESATSAIVTNAPNLDILYKLTLDVQRFNAMQTIADPIPTARAPMEIGIEIDIHTGSMSCLCEDVTPDGRINNHASSCVHSAAVESLVKPALRLAPCRKGIQIPPEPLLQPPTQAPTPHGCRC